jgi:Na+-driven multidrug efflux pump
MAIDLTFRGIIFLTRLFRGKWAEMSKITTKR